MIRTLDSIPVRLPPAPRGKPSGSGSTTAAALAALLCTAGAARAAPETHAAPLTGNQPVTFLADRVSYDKLNGIVTATGHVQAWQNDHYMAADEVTFDRNTDVAAARGHVVIVEPDGQIVFGDYAEMSQGMKEGIISGMRSYLADGGKLAANGARRTDGKLNELSKAVYSSCNVCALNPDAPPEWQFRSEHMTQDLEHKRIEYSDSWFDVYGFPIFWLPYMSSTDPSVKRQSGFLVPSIGASSEHLGAFASLPYYWVLDDQSDLLLTPEVNAEQGGQLQADYRRWFNEGRINIQGGIAHDDNQMAYYTFSSANFVWNDTWRYGANINFGNSATYLRDYQLAPFVFNVLSSNAYIEGFGVGSYAKLDVVGYQGLNASIDQSTLPYVLPRYTYSFLGEPDFLGGRFYFDTMDFNIIRDQGADTRRLAARAGWQSNFGGPLGEQYQVNAEISGAAYQATVFNGQPDYGDSGATSVVHAQPQVAIKMNWPFVRDAGSLGTQLVEPIVQLIAGPNSGNGLHDRLPNEDSLDYEFTDATLFSRNRFGGYDRYDGGARANFALHGSWTFKGGQVLDAMVGASAIEHIDHNLYPQFQPWNGFAKGSHLSDVVGRVSFLPSKWYSITARARVDHDNGDLRFADAINSVGPKALHFNFGYFYDSTNPYALYLSDFLAAGYLVPTNPALKGSIFNFFAPRNELSAGVGSTIGHFSVSIDGRRDLETGQADSLNLHLHWEDECTGFDMLAGRRYTSILGDHGDTTVLFTITLKTVGQFGFK
ncbi:MAG TPA: LPS assembly protein LptD [Acetobacteraceae bacterium]|nr:LPS assembly protein LptD [Acetobacteraceae bacterium]